MRNLPSASRWHKIETFAVEVYVVSREKKIQCLSYLLSTAGGRGGRLQKFERPEVQRRNLRHSIKRNVFELNRNQAPYWWAQNAADAVVTRHPLTRIQAHAREIRSRTRACTYVIYNFLYCNKIQVNWRTVVKNIAQGEAAFIDGEKFWANETINMLREQILPLKAFSFCTLEDVLEK